MAQDPKNNNRHPSRPAPDGRRNINENKNPTRVNNGGTADYSENNVNTVRNTAAPPDRGNKPKK